MTCSRRRRRSTPTWRATSPFIALEGQLARAYFFLDEDRRAIEVADRVLEAAERADLVAILADALVTRGSALANMGRVREGLGVIEIGERLARENGYTHTLLRALNNRAINGVPVRSARALAAAAEGLTVARRVGDRGSASLYINGVAFGHVQRGEWDEALAVAASMATEDLAPSDRGNVIQQPFSSTPSAATTWLADMAEIEQILPAFSEHDRRITRRSTSRRPSPGARAGS